MNTLIHIIAITALFWLAFWFFDNSTSAVPGLVVVGVVFLFLSWTIQAVVEDVSDFREKRRRD